MSSIDKTLAASHAGDEAEARALRESLRLPSGTLTEVIHHGEYYRRREQPAGHSVSAEELRLFVDTSPYVYKVEDEPLSRMLSDINMAGETYLGHSRFYLERPAAE